MYFKHVCVGVVLLIAMRASAQEAGKKLPVPGDDVRAEALKSINEVYGAQTVAAKTVDLKRALAEKLIAKAVESKGDPTNHFMLLQLARDTATQTGEVEVAFRAIEETDRAFQIDAWALKIDTFEKAARAASGLPQCTSIVNRAGRLIDELLAKDDFETAAKVGGAALGPARKSGSKDLLAEVVTRNKEIKQIANAFSEVQGSLAVLKQTPADPAANAAVGKYLCFMKGKWDLGLPLLANGIAPALKELAALDVKGVSGGSAQAKLGDDWWQLSQDEDGLARKQLMSRAGVWYRRALPELKGLAKDKTEQRLAELRKIEGKPHPQWTTYVFPDRESVLRDFTVEGEWRVESNAVVLSGGSRPGSLKSKTSFSFPIAVEYQMYMLPDRPYDLFPGFAGILVGYATFSNTRTQLNFSGRTEELRHTKAVPNHLYRIVVYVDKDRTLAVYVDGAEIVRKHLDSQISLQGPVFIGPLWGHVGCERIVVCTNPPADPTGKR